MMTFYVFHQPAFFNVSIRDNENKERSLLENDVALNANSQKNNGVCIIGKTNKTRY